MNTDTINTTSYYGSVIPTHRYANKIRPPKNDYLFLGFGYETCEVENFRFRVESEGRLATQKEFAADVEKVYILSGKLDVLDSDASRGTFSYRKKGGGKRSADTFILEQKPTPRRSRSGMYPPPEPNVIKPPEQDEDGLGARF